MLVISGLKHKRLERECRVFARYLIGTMPVDYAVQKYLAYHDQSAAKATTIDTFDRVLLVVARMSHWGVCLADSYASRFRKHSVLRRKLVLVLAILECASPSYQVIDAAYQGNAVWIMARLVWHGAMYAVAVTTAALMLGPLHVATSLMGALRRLRS